MVFWIPDSSRERQESVMEETLDLKHYFSKLQSASGAGQSVLIVNTKL